MKKDLLHEATLARNALTRLPDDAPKGAQSAAKELEKAIDAAASSIQAKREALAKALK